MAVLNISLLTNSEQASQLTSASPMAAIRKASAIIRALLANGKGKMWISTDSSSTLVRASNTVTITHANLAAADTITIGNVVITARASGATGAEFNIGADATADATALAAAIVANVPGITASSALGVVTVTCLTAGVIGNRVTLATSKASAFAFGSSHAYLEGGTGVSGVPIYYARGVA